MDFVVGGEVDDTDDFVYEQTEAERADGPAQPDDAEMTEAALLETPDSEPLSRADLVQRFLFLRKSASARVAHCSTSEV